MSPPKPGSFEYLEASIRRDAEGTLFGRDFEWVCQWYLEHAPLYRGKFRKVWRWAGWPDRWGPDCGVDLIAETHDGELWAIQAKAVGPDHSITKAEIDSFLAESNRPQIAFRLLIGTTDNIGANARRTIDEQAKHAAVALRGDLVSADIVWPARVGGVAPKPRRAKPRPHQKKAVAAVLRGFRKHNRGRLIMACGTGKTLTGLWVHERLKSRRTLLLVPSISLVQQNLREWGRHARKDFDFLVVCSDESVASDRDDPALRYIAELGIDVTTEATDIAAFLAKRRCRPAVVIATYQSSDRVSVGQRKARKQFDLALCDEAHRLVGDMRGKFATILDDRKIRCCHRLFMTATPRYFTQRARQRAADEDLEVASMDDPATFGPEFHVLNFYDAITAKPTRLLTDYRVVVIGVTNAEAARWVEEGKLVRTRKGAETDARTLAAQIGLAKAMREYDLRRVITFHRSIRRASRFVDEARRDSLPSIIETLRPASRPSGKLWARHISGETPASKRASMLRALAELPAGTRGLIANCACLGEGVDVPALDGIAFIDPKGSMVDIIQAVGRVIRLSDEKTIGTILIPVFIDQTGTTEYALEQSAFAPVWQVLKALRAHDQRLADELDTLRTSLGKERGSRVALPANIVLKVPRLVLGDFEQAFYVRVIKQASVSQQLTIETILGWADAYHAAHGSWPLLNSGRIPGTAETWHAVDNALRAGLRGLPEGSSLPRLLDQHRGVPNRLDLPDLSEEGTLSWADTYYTTHGRWPTRTSGTIAGTQEQWSRINDSLIRGLRGLKGGITLAELLTQRRGMRSSKSLPDLTLSTILAWADTFFKQHKRWPKAGSGPIRGTKETWSAIDSALRDGRRGVRRRSSLARLLSHHRGTRNHYGLPKLSESRILAWADEYFDANGRWPTSSSGVAGEGPETWRNICSALARGGRGLPGGQTLRSLLRRRRGPMSKDGRLHLSVKDVLKWADEFFQESGEWPTVRSGSIVGTTESWSSVAYALKNGTRGLKKSPGLNSLLAKHRGVRPRSNSARLELKTLLRWADEHRDRNGAWPNKRSGLIEGTNGMESWGAVNSALYLGLRGFAGGSSLADVLAKHRGVPNQKALAPLSVRQILSWAESHLLKYGEWPSLRSGLVDGTSEEWRKIDAALRFGRRRLPRGSSLATLLDKHRRKRGAGRQRSDPSRRR